MFTRKIPLYKQVVSMLSTNTRGTVHTDNCAVQTACHRLHYQTTADMEQLLLTVIYDRYCYTVNIPPLDSMQNLNQLQKQNGC